MEWSTQYGTSGSDFGNAITVDPAGKIWVGGLTGGSLGGANAGGSDVFLSRLSADGTVDFTRQRGGSRADEGYGVAVVGSGAVFLGGHTDSTTLDGRAALGEYDALAVRYDTTGTWVGTTRFGSSVEDRVYALAGNATNLLTAGDTAGSFGGQTNAFQHDAVLTKRDSTGAAVWTRLIGTSAYEIAFGTDFDSAGNSYMTGYTTGSLPGSTNAGSGDLFVARYNSAGTRTLLKQVGSGEFDYPQAIKVDGAGNIYLTGFTAGNLGGQTHAGAADQFSSDAFVMKLSAAGNVLWTRLLGGTGEEDSLGLGLDSAGHLWIGGWSDTGLGSHAATPGVNDSFVAEYDSDGLHLGTTFLPSGNSQIQGLAIGADDSVYVTGITSSSDANGDVFVAKINPGPEPSQVPALVNPRRSEVNGTAKFHFELLGEAGRTYQLQSSKALDVWTNLERVTLSAPLLPIEIAIPSGQTQQFYRAIPQQRDRQL